MPKKEGGDGPKNNRTGKDTSIPFPYNGRFVPPQRVIGGGDNPEEMLSDKLTPEQYRRLTEEAEREADRETD